MKNEYKLVELIQKLKARNNKAYIFFETLLSELKDRNQSREAIEKLVRSFAITQYADFTAEEENLLGQIIDENLDEE